jgi:hypothetical protein
MVCCHTGKEAETQVAVTLVVIFILFVVVFFLVYVPISSYAQDAVVVVLVHSASKTQDEN